MGVGISYWSKILHLFKDKTKMLMDAAIYFILRSASEA